MYVHFRKRLGEEALANYNEVIVKRAIKARENTESIIDVLHTPSIGEATNL